MTPEALQPDGILARLVADAVRLGANEMEFEYKDGYDEVFAMKGAMGVGIANLDSSGEDDAALRDELWAIRKKGKTLSVDGTTYHVKATTYDSFNETAFRVRIRRASDKPTCGTR